MEIIEAGFVVVVVATVTKRIKIGKGRAGSLLIDDAGSGRIGNPNQLAPRVVGVGGVGLLCVAGDVAVGILNCNRSEDFHHVALLVQRVEVVCEFRAVVLRELEAKGAALGVVGEHHDFGRSAFSDFLPNDLAVQRPVLMLCAVDVLRRANPVGIVGILARLAAGGDLCELAAVLPRQAAVVPSTGREVPEMPLTGDFPPGDRLAGHIWCYAS